MLRTLLATALLGVCSADPLLLTPYVQAGLYSEARELSAIDVNGTDMGYSAFFSVPSASSQNTNNIFFWFQPCLNNCDPASVPFIIWFQGGPGGPGTFGALSEIGNWCATYNCLFVDQPTMTGFSYQVNSSGEFDPNNIEYTATSQDAMEQIWLLMEQFYQVFPEYLPAPFYITGESYGGLYTAWFGYTVWQHNQAGDMKINLQGLAVGDPIINSEYQWPTYGSTLHGMGVIMSDEQVECYLFDSQAMIDEVMSNGIALLDVNCTQAFGYWNSVWNDNGGGGYPGLYYQLTGSSMTENVLLGAEPAGFGYGMAWLELSATAEALHYSGSPANSQSEGNSDPELYFISERTLYSPQPSQPPDHPGGLVYQTMVDSGDFCSNSSWLYAHLLLVAQIDLMIYSSTVGLVYLIIPFSVFLTTYPLLGPPTTEAGVGAVWIDGMHLPGGSAAFKAYSAAQKVVWRINASDIEPAGYARCFTAPAGNNFCYTVVRNGGHELPAFQPASAYDMIMRFIQGRPFDQSGNFPNPPNAPQCAGEPPFTGYALPACVCADN